MLDPAYYDGETVNNKSVASYLEAAIAGGLAQML